MRRRITTCDICGEEIEDYKTGWKKIRIKEYCNDYVNFDEPEFLKWRKMDICHKCAEEAFEYFITLAYRRKEKET